MGMFFLNVMRRKPRVPFSRLVVADSSRRDRRLKLDEVNQDYSGPAKYVSPATWMSLRSHLWTRRGGSR
jgi:hypothetical protein